MKKHLRLTLAVIILGLILSIFSSFGQTNTASSGKNLRFTVNGATFEMIFVKGGTFMLGCYYEQRDWEGDEKPPHSVTLSDFYMGKYEVTQKLWQAVMGTNVRQQCDLVDKSYPLRGEGGDYPMCYIDYYECVEFCGKLNKLLSDKLPKGYKFRMPTEAQWEYAARGGQKSKGYQYSGSDDIGEVAWYDDNSKRAHEVGLKDENELGIYDMSGNVLEWCVDWYGKYSSIAQFNPKGPSSGTYRVLRGGCWFCPGPLCRVSSRVYLSPDNRTSTYGFRLALVP